MAHDRSDRVCPDDAARWLVRTRRGWRRSQEEIARFHDTLAALREDFANPALAAQISDEQFLQGPLSDAMTHAGQLAMLRRMAGSPVASENFIFATIRTDNVSADQAEPAAPDAWWRPDQPPQPPGGNKVP